MTPDRVDFDNILVPLDGSAFAEHALPVAATLAQRCGGCLRLVAVEPRLLALPAMEQPAHLRQAHARSRERTLDYLVDIEARVRGPRHVRTTIEVRDGPPAEGLLGAIEEHDVDLVVMTSHGRGGLRRAWLGSVADELIRRSSAPVLLLKPDEEAETDLRARRDMPAIVVPLDGSDAAEGALAPALAIAELHPAPITLLRVVTPPMTMLPGPVPFAVVDRDAQARERAAAERYLQHITERLRRRGVETTSALVEADAVADAILAHADDADAVIVLATQGHGGIRRIVLGSVADKVIRGARGPVVAVHPAEGRDDHAVAAEHEEWSGAALLAAAGAVDDARANHDPTD